MSKIEQLITDYLNYLEVDKNYSPRTREAYDRYLMAFIQFVNVKNPEEINIKNIENFRIYLARNKNQKGNFVKKSTQGYYMIALRNFLKYLIKRDFKVLAPDKIELPKIPIRQIDILNYEDMERLLKAPGEGGNLRELRDRAILEMFFSTGLRISELCALDRYIDIKRGEASIRGKGSKLRMVFLSEDAKRILKNYLKKKN
jgi:site-specific recombinase XerD